MPSYEYLCAIHNEFEVFHSSRDESKLTECPQCREENNISTPVERLISPGGRGIVELTGRDAVDKAKVDAQQFKRDVHKSENLYSNILGSDKYQALQQKIDKNRRG